MKLGLILLLCAQAKSGPPANSQPNIPANQPIVILPSGQVITRGDFEKSATTDLNNKNANVPPVRNPGPGPSVAFAAGGNAFNYVGDVFSDRIRAWADAAVEYGRAKNMEQEAIARAIENRKADIELMRQYKSLVDENKFSNTVTGKLVRKVATEQIWLAARRQEIENAKAKAELRGFAPRKKGSIGIEGHRYPSYEAFKQTAHYQDWMTANKKRFQAEEAKRVADESSYKAMVKDLGDRNPANYARKWEKEAHKIQHDVEHSLEYRLFVLHEDIPYAEWPDSWKEAWRKEAERINRSHSHH